VDAGSFGCGMMPWQARFLGPRAADYAQVGNADACPLSSIITAPFSIIQGWPKYVWRGKIYRF
jgi:hypothetical protein